MSSQFKGWRIVEGQNIGDIYVLTPRGKVHTVWLSPTDDDVIWDALKVELSSPKKAIRVAYEELCIPFGDGYVNIGQVADLAACLMGGNYKKNLATIQRIIEQSPTDPEMHYVFSTHLARNLHTRKRWPDGGYLEHGIKISNRHYKVMALKYYSA